MSMQEESCETSADGRYCLRYKIDRGKDFEASFRYYCNGVGSKIISIINA